MKHFKYKLISKQESWISLRFKKNILMFSLSFGSLYTAWYKTPPPNPSLLKANSNKTPTVFEGKFPFLGFCVSGKNFQGRQTPVPSYMLPDKEVAPVKAAINNSVCVLILKMKGDLFTDVPLKREWLWIRSTGFPFTGYPCCRAVYSVAYPAKWIK